MNIILFGPPGIGKSTMIGLLKAIGYGAIDLEDFYPSKTRFAVPNQVNNKFLGAADLNPKRTYRNCVKVLLITNNQDEYDKRRAARDAKQQSKKDQAHHLIQDWIKGSHYDHIINASTPGQTKNALVALAKRYFKSTTKGDAL